VAVDPNKPFTVALIGSFKQHNVTVQETVEIFRRAGVQVLSPRGAHIVKDGIPFVRFGSDPGNWTDEMIQVVALHRILKASLVFVVAPDGYIGRTTCYEIGRIVNAGKPIYFGERPLDLPLFIPLSHIQSAQSIADQISGDTFCPHPLHSEQDGHICLLEQDLLHGRYHDL